MTARELPDGNALFMAPVGGDDDDFGSMVPRLEVPPKFIYSKFFDEEVPSDTRMKILFPEDVELRTNHRDKLTESNSLYFFRRSIILGLDATKSGP